QKRVTHLRGLGIGAINLDLVYGLPGQTPGSFGTTIDKIVQLHPSRIALFGYAHVPWVSPHQKVMEKHHIPTPTERMALFGKAFDLLLSAGYQHVGMDHFALPDDELMVALRNRTLKRNFMGYTTRRGLDLAGIGASSISSVGITYAQNEKDIDKYINNDPNTSHQLHWIKGLIMTPGDNLRRELIMDLFCNFYLDTTALEKKFQIDFFQHFAAELEVLKPMENDGLIQINEKDGELVV
ncbi:MAG: oxygen-independent coproporphyrinogen III oxidase, partial [bacterium]|nr:oxygen-independent coproporphyrinogen III oxidase [bacterium]